jgi:hypothetical protein
LSTNGAGSSSAPLWLRRLSATKARTRAPSVRALELTFNIEGAFADAQQGAQAATIAVALLRMRAAPSEALDHVAIIGRAHDQQCRWRGCSALHDPCTKSIPLRERRTSMPIAGSLHEKVGARGSAATSAQSLHRGEQGGGK